MLHGLIFASVCRRLLSFRWVLMQWGGKMVMEMENGKWQLGRCASATIKHFKVSLKASELCHCQAAPLDTISIDLPYLPLPTPFPPWC